MTICTKTFYQSILNYILSFYIIFKLNSDHKKFSINDFLKGFFCMIIWYNGIYFLRPDLKSWIVTMLNILGFIIVIMVFLKWSLHLAVFSSVFNLIILGISEIITLFIYEIFFKFNKETYRNSIMNMTIAGILIFIFSYLLLKIFTDKIVKCRDNLFKYKTNNVKMLLTISTPILLVILIGYNIFYQLYFLKQYNVTEKKFIIDIFFLFLILIILIVLIVYLVVKCISQKIKYDELKRKSSLDLMTRSLNRYTGVEFIKKQMDLSEKLNMKLTICYLDINGLKYVNDNFGHLIGDELIKYIVETIRENIRCTDKITRVGGDEFIIIFPGCDVKNARKILINIESKLKCTNTNVNGLKKVKNNISFSYGLAQYNKNETVEELISRADMNMYVYKRRYKNNKNVAIR